MRRGATRSPSSNASKISLASVTYPALDLRFASGPGAGTLQDMLYAELDAFEPAAIQEHEAGDGWRIFFHTPASRDAARATLASEFGSALLELVALDVDDEDWARRSQAALTAVRVGRIVVAPPWTVESLITDHSSGITDPASRIADPESRIADPESRIADPESRIPNPDIIIVIDPSMGFGTGHHATTRLCLELLQRNDVRGKRAIDVGTGSGVLALAAWGLGASSVSALDNDADALQNARENIERNRAADSIDVLEADLSRVTLSPADIVVANLTGAVLQRHASALKQLVVGGGVLIVSGFGRDEAGEVARAFGEAPREIVREGEWAAAVFHLALL
jgi:ribosomal protein L11 methylase PrmA